MDSHLRTREEVPDLAPEARCCSDCGELFEVLGSENSEQVDWQVTITRIVHRRCQYRRCSARQVRRQISAWAGQPCSHGRVRRLTSARDRGLSPNVLERCRARGRRPPRWMVWGLTAGRWVVSG
jgi:hypothetical protein